MHLNELISILINAAKYMDQPKLWSDPESAILRSRLLECVNASTTGNILFPFRTSTDTLVHCSITDLQESGWPINEHTGEDLPLAL